MSKIVMLIGSVIFSLLMYSVPIVCVCSLVFHWSGPIKTALLSFCIAQVVMLARCVYAQAEDELWSR